MTGQMEAKRAAGLQRTPASDTTPSGVCCDHCQLEYERGYRPDPCLGGYLPDVAHACCGHGDPLRAYVCGGEGAVPDQGVPLIEKHWDLRGLAAIDFFAKLGIGPSRLEVAT